MAGSTSETPVLDLLRSMTGESVLATSLEDQDMMLVRIASLVAVDAPVFSYRMNLEAAAEVGVDDSASVVRNQPKPARTSRRPNRCDAAWRMAKSPTAMGIPTIDARAVACRAAESP